MFLLWHTRDRASEKANESISQIRKQLNLYESKITALNNYTKTLEYQIKALNKVIENANNATL